MSLFLSRLFAILRKPPKYILARLLGLLFAQLERVRLPLLRSTGVKRFLSMMGCQTIDELWLGLGKNPVPFFRQSVHEGRLTNELGEHYVSDLRSRADAAMRREVSLLGSEITAFKTNIDWHTDFKTGTTWPNKFFADYEYNNKGQPSDVKVPWELSRIQWAMPMGLAYLVFNEETYAKSARELLDSWIESNPVGKSINWACTMEAAMRVFVWIWLFCIFKDSEAWAQRDFQFKFLRALYFHLDFTDRHIELSDINGNHFTADAAALAFGGEFFANHGRGSQWSYRGWRLLNDEISLQTGVDGVNFEGSTAYHRLVTELFFWPAAYRLIKQKAVSKSYEELLVRMAEYTQTYSKPNYSAPLLGDADDARVLPFGFQDINDHSYLIALVGSLFNKDSLMHCSPESCAELFWTYGPESVSKLSAACSSASSRAFTGSGYYILGSDIDHIMIDCAPIGQAGRGGHGHNDCLSYELFLDDCPLISDRGSFLYTASYTKRNEFRSTASHNTPIVDSEEINRFIHPDYLWTLHNDAKPVPLEFYEDQVRALFQGAHLGYMKLRESVVPVRTWALDKKNHAAVICDYFLGRGKHEVEVPIHLAPNVKIESWDGENIGLSSNGRKFSVSWWASHGCSVPKRGATTISPSYGVELPSTRISWQVVAEGPTYFSLAISNIEVRADVIRNLKDFAISTTKTLSMDSVLNTFNTRELSAPEPRSQRLSVDEFRK